MKNEITRVLEEFLKYYFYTDTSKYEEIKKVLMDEKIRIKYSRTRIDFFRSFSLPTNLPFSIFRVRKDISNQKKEILNSFDKIILNLEAFLKEDCVEEKTKQTILRILNISTQ